MGTVRNPDLQDCINYMKSQIKQMKKYPKSYEFNIPYYEKTVEYLETRGTTDGNCATCVKAVVADERPHGEWLPFEYDENLDPKPLPKGSPSEMEEYWAEEFMCSNCGALHHYRKYCPNCGALMVEEEGDGT